MKPSIVLIGDVCVDVMLTRPAKENSLRLGGIIHAARALWALGITYDLAYIAPQYLTDQIEDYAQKHGARATYNVGVVQGAANVAIITEPTEAGPQGYEILLRDAYNEKIDIKELEKALNNFDTTDILIFPGQYKLEPILGACNQCKAKIHIDVAHGIEKIAILSYLERKFDTGIISTSSSLFIDQYKGSVAHLREDLLKDCFNTLLFKENRGGARFFDQTNNVITIGAQVQPIVHSIGVGDCFNSAYIALVHTYSVEVALTYAAWIAREYASTTYPDDFKNRCDKVMVMKAEEIIELKGISVPWETRSDFNIYVAAPDFDYVDTKAINQVVECLTYHNFCPRLPIRENGQLELNATSIRKQEIYDSDIKLLLECQLLLAVMLFDDPGTIFEIGFAVGRGMPVIVYDPYHKVRNPMLSQSANLVSSNLDEIVCQVFECASKR